MPWGVALVGAAYAVFLRLRGGGVDSNALYVSAALIAGAEAAYVALQARAPAADSRTRWDAPARVVAVAFAALLGGGIVLVASGATGGGLAVEAIGVAAAVISVAAVVLGGARTRDAP